MPGELGRYAPVGESMSYIEKICEPLTATLNHSVTLPVHQLSGHCANIDFWLSEVRHRLAVIDGYRDRFQRMKDAQDTYQRQHTSFSGGPLKRSTKDHERNQVRRNLVAAIERFLVRCQKDGLIDNSQFEASFESLGLSVPP